MAQYRVIESVLHKTTPTEIKRLIINPETKTVAIGNKTDSHIELGNLTEPLDRGPPRLKTTLDTKILGLMETEGALHLLFYLQESQIRTPVTTIMLQAVCHALKTHGLPDANVKIPRTVGIGFITLGKMHSIARGKWAEKKE